MEETVQEEDEGEGEGEAEVRGVKDRHSSFSVIVLVPTLSISLHHINGDLPSTSTSTLHATHNNIHQLQQRPRTYKHP